MREADGDDEAEEDIWGGSDEEVCAVTPSWYHSLIVYVQADDSQKELMRRTARHILSSPNPPQLEMRILANYGGDKRFAFLRGRWARFWKSEKRRVKMESEASESKKAQDDGRSGTGLFGLADYGDSDQDNDHGDGELELDTEVSVESKAIVEIVAADNVSERDGNESDAVIKEARRARAKEWAKKRRASKSDTVWHQRCQLWAVSN